jgi:hypothetical protein
MRTSIALVAAALALTSCESKGSSRVKETGSATADRKPSASLVDLTAASALAPVRAAFNAHKGEARFLTLLSPT